MLELLAQIREKTGKKVKSLRRRGLLPAVLYRKDKENVNLQLNYTDFEKIFREAGESTVIKLKIIGESDKVDIKSRERNVLIADVARDPVNDNFIHVDFHEVKMDEKITATVPLEFVGESPAVKVQSGTLVKNIQEVRIKALPIDLPHHLEVDISSLATFEDRILIKDIKVPQGVEIMAEADEVVALVMPPRKEEEMVAEVPAKETVVEAASKEETREGTETENK